MVRYRLITILPAFIAPTDSVIVVSPAISKIGISLYLKLNFFIKS